jgi:hypothetical protein
MNRLKTNIIIDILMLVSFAAMSFSGFVLQMRRVFFANRSPFMGMSRHTWSDIHLWSAIVVLVLLVLHLVLHWKAVAGFFKKSIASPAVRYAVYLQLVVLALVTVVPWFFAF